MGTTIRDVLSTVILTLLLCAIITIGQDDFDPSVAGVEKGVRARDFQTAMDERSKAAGRRCSCPDCSTGLDCAESLERVDPKFAVLVKFIEVPEFHRKGKVALHYNTTTYPGAPHCLCDAFEYSITDVRDVVNPENTNNKDVFVINEKTGQLYLHEDKLFADYDMYDVTISVRNVNTDVSDSVTLTVARGQRNIMDKYSPFPMNGYEDQVPVHHLLSRHKRAYTPPTETTFLLTQITSETEIRVGQRVEFRLEIEFPATAVDILVELFTPDNETTVMILCNVQVDTASAVNLNTSGYTAGIVYSSRFGNSYQHDMAEIALNTVSNIGAPAAQGDNTITITYEAVMIENSNTQNTTYWVSAGAEYLSENYIYVAQASFEAIVDGNMTVDSDPIFNVTLPSTLSLGSTSMGTVDMYIPYPTREYVFKVFSPPNTVGLVSICAIAFDSFGDNFVCGNDAGQITASLESDPQAMGNAVGILDLGVLLNKGSRDPVVTIADNRISLSFMVHLYPDASKIGLTESLGLAIEVDNTIMWIGNYDFLIADVDPAAPVNPTLDSIDSSLTTWDATLEEPFTIVYNLSIPTSATASHYVLELLAPLDVSNMPIFSVCSFTVTFIGADIPCKKVAELITEFSSRDTTGASIEPDRATIELGYITNLNQNGGLTDDLISVEAVMKPLSSNPSASVPSSHLVTFGVTVQGGALINIHDQSVNIANAAAYAPITNLTAPTFTMAYSNGIDVVDVMGSAEIIIDMTTVRNTLYDEMTMEFLLPYGTTGTYFHVCRVDIVSTGKNMPCMTPEWYNTHMQYFTQFDSYLMDRAKLYLGGMCNKEFENDYKEDVTSFALYLKVLDVPELTHMSSYYMSSGLLYSNVSLWVGQIKLDVRRGSTTSPTKPYYGFFTSNSTSDPVPFGLTKTHSVFLKIGRGDTAHIKVNVTASSPDVHICTVRVFNAGHHLPCASDEVSIRTADYWPDGLGYKSVQTDIGLITNYGDTSSNMTANDYYDHDTVLLEVIVRANPDPSSTPGTYGFNVKAYASTDETSFLEWTDSSFVTTNVHTGVNTTVGDPVLRNMTFGEIAGGDNSANASSGEVRKVVVTAEIPEGTNYQLIFAFVIPVSYVGKLELCDAYIESAGDNVPCVDVDQEPLITSTDGIYNDAATFDLGYTCSHPLRPGDTKANTITFVSYVRVVPNGLATIGETLEVTSTLLIFTSPVVVESLFITVDDPVNFEDKVASLVGVSNDTLISIDALNPLPMAIAENVTLNVSVSVPPWSSSKVLIDVSLPVDTSACMTVGDIRVLEHGGEGQCIIKCQQRTFYHEATDTVYLRAFLANQSTGKNVLCVDPTINNKSVVYTPTYNDSTGTGQRNYVYLDLGIVTNTGRTYAKNTNTSDDDVIALEIDLQLADCPSNQHNSIQTVSIGNKVANYIFIYDHTVQVVRTTDQPDIVLEASVNASSTSATVFLDGVVYHSNTSTAEGYNTTVAVRWPMYMYPTYSFVANSDKPCNIVPVVGSPELIEIFCDNFFFVDVFTFTIQADVNNTVLLPSGYSSEFTTTLCDVSTDMRGDLASPYDWYPYATTSSQSVEFNVVTGAPSCSDVLGMENGMIADCQISGSEDDINPASQARLNNPTGWEPYVRDGASAKNRFITVMFGNFTKVTMIDIQQTCGHVVLVNEITVEYTNDGDAFFGTEVLALTNPPTTLETVSTSGTTARGIRISISNTTNNAVRPAVCTKFELKGCLQSTDFTLADVCALVASQVVTRPDDFEARSFVVGFGGVNAYVCDRVVSKSFRGHCHSTSDSGTTWTSVDKRLAAVIGYEDTGNRVYGYAADRSTILLSVDNGQSFQAADSATLAADKLLTWTSAIVVPETGDANLDQATPHLTYSQGTFGATYEGIFESNVLKLKWSST